MLSFHRMLRRIRSLLTTPRLDDDLDEELRFHIEMETAKRVRSGMDEATARQSALRDFGGARYRDETRDARGVRAIEDFVQDVRIGLRTIASQRTYAVVAVLTLAIGIGATTALWAALYRVLLQPYPFRDADRIVTVWEHDTKAPQRARGVAPANFLDWKKRSRTLDLIAAAEPYSLDWIGPEGPERFEVALVTDDFFPLQGLRPLLGRAFLPEEFQAGRSNVVVLTEALWRARFGADSTLIGRTLVLDSVPRVVVGVMPSDAMQPFDAEAWVPKIFRPHELNSRTGGYWQVAARMAPGVSLEQARDEMRRIAGQLATEFPATNSATGFSIVTLRDSIAGSVRRTLFVLFGAVALVLLIACVNVANLQLAECIRRQRELAIRTAIGAGRSRLVRQLVTESLLVALIGALGGLGVAYAAIGAIRAFAPSDMWQLADLSMERSTAMFALALALASALAISIMPVIAASRIHLAQSLTASGRSGTATMGRRRANRLLVVSEVALALVLLVGTGLLLRSFSVLMQSDRGFHTDGILVTDLQSWSYYPTPVQRAEFVRQAQQRLAAIPGVASVGMTSSLPLTWPIGFERTPMSLEGQTRGPGDEVPTVRAAAVTKDYFTTMGIPLVAGRALAETDAAGAPMVVLINRAFARRFFGDRNPLGQRISFGFMSPPVAREVIGVVGDVRHEGLHADFEPGVYVPHAQAPTGATFFLVRTPGDPALLQRAVRTALTEINGVMPISEITTMNALLAGSLRQRSFQLGLFSAFSITALILSAIGIYGVMSRVTSERTHEIGVRMAIGAHASDVRWMVLRNGGGLAVGGIVAGVVIALVLTRYMSSMLFGVTPLDLPTYLGAAGVLLGAAVLASWLPAWRASVVDPVVALRSD